MNIFIRNFLYHFEWVYAIKAAKVTSAFAAFLCRRGEDKPAVREGEMENMTVGVEAEQVVVQFLLDLSADRLPEACRLVREDTLYETPGLDLLS